MRTEALCLRLKIINLKLRLVVHRKEDDKMNEIKEYTEKIFEDIKHIDKNGSEYWLARELQNVLGYHQWRSINDLIERAKAACQESKYNIDDHFALYRKMVDIGSKTTRKIIDYKLSRYACYLIVMNGNPQKETIALGQTYFAIQTRKQELSEIEYNELSEDEKRLCRRNQARKGNYNILDHFIGVNKMVKIGSNTKRKIQDYKLSRYACYLMVLNCDPRKKVSST